MKFTTEIYKRNEIVLHSAKEYDNPFFDVDIDATFTCDDGTSFTLPGFWNGGNEWKVRFSIEKPGNWTYEVACTDKSNASLCDKGEIAASVPQNPQTELTRRGYPRLDKNKRYFEYGDGTPFFYLADTHWMMFDYEHLHDCNCPGCSCGSQFKHVVNDRIKKGFTVYQTYMAGARLGVSNAGTEPWWQDNYRLINPKPFNETMDVMMDYLAENGLAISLGMGTHQSTIFEFTQRHGDNTESLLRLARYIVARYACYPVIWITAQEITSVKFNAFEVWNRVGALVGQLDGYNRPNGAHMNCHPYTDDRAKKLGEQPWHQWWTVQGGHGGYYHLPSRKYYQGYYEAPGNKLFIESENQYEDIYCNGFCGHDASRYGAYLAMQSGAAGFTYGVAGLWAMSYDLDKNPAFKGYNTENWYSGVVKPGSEQVGYMRSFYEYVGWYRLVPEFGFDYGVFEMRNRVAISHIDDDVFVYYFYGIETKETGFITGLKPNTKYQARWYDTVNGKFIDLPDVITPDGRMNVPEMPLYHRDWLLLLNDYDLGEYETEAYPENPVAIPPTEATPGEKYEIRHLYASSEDREHPASNMLDGRPDTYWRGYAPKTSQTLIADLGEAKELGYMHWRSDLPTFRYVQFRIHTSDDGEKWEMQAERSYTEVATGGQYNEYYEPLRGKHRFVKLFINAVPKESPINTQLELTDFSIWSKK